MGAVKPLNHIDYINLIGWVKGNLTLTSIVGRDETQRILVSCSCSICGAHRVVRLDYFRQYKSKRCGCSRSKCNPEDSSLCNICATTIKRCSWLWDYTPVAGWVADYVPETGAYNVRKCPIYTKSTRTG